MMKHTKLTDNNFLLQLLTIAFILTNQSVSGQFFNSKLLEFPKYKGFNEPNFNLDNSNKVMTAQDVEKQLEKARKEFMGGNEPPTQEEIQKGLYYQRLEKKKLENQKMLDEIINEARTKYPTFREKEIPQKLRLADTSKPGYQTSFQYYQASLQLLEEMLEDKQPLDLKRAVFFTEKACDQTLVWAKFQSDIAYWKSIVKQILDKEKLDSTNALAVNFCIQKLFWDTIQIIDPRTNKKKEIKPFVYDFVDFYADIDHRNYMVTKLLRTHSGQCHSMPLLYLILANEFKAEANIANSPSHTFIMFKDAYDRYLSFETTTGYLSTRDMYLETNYIKSEALKNGIYLRPVTLKETIAACIADLGMYYTKQFGLDDFVLTCGIMTKKYAVANWSAQIMLENVGTAYMLDEAKRCGWPDVKEKHNYPKLNKLHQIMTDLQTETDMMGYEEMPKDAYERWVKSMEIESEKQKRNSTATTK